MIVSVATLGCLDCHGSQPLLTFDCCPSDSTGSRFAGHVLGICKHRTQEFALECATRVKETLISICRRTI